MEDLTGKKYGALLCTERKSEKLWRCQCDCGNEIDVPESWLKARLQTSCGCRQSRAMNLTNQRFGHLVALEPLPKRAAGNCLRWLCRCDCGEYTITSSNKLRTGHTASCGCCQIAGARQAKTFIDGTCLEILMSEKVPVNNASGYRGVCRYGDRWQAYITYAGKMKALGKFDSVEEAATARAKAMEQIKTHIAQLMARETEDPADTDEPDHASA